MKEALIKKAVRARFAMTGKERASQQIKEALAKYMDLAKNLAAETGSLEVHVPRMLGVDEDMRNWSTFMILEHNSIVNRSITEIVDSLANGREPTGGEIKDPKKDVMPSAQPGAEQIGIFRDTVERHLDTVSRLSGLRETATRRHPIFGEFNAHQWHCMFGFHLDIHLKQAAYVIKAASESA